MIPWSEHVGGEESRVFLMGLQEERGKPKRPQSGKPYTHIPLERNTLKDICRADFLPSRKKSYVVSEMVYHQ